MQKKRDQQTVRRADLFLAGLIVAAAVTGMLFWRIKAGTQTGSIVTVYRDGEIVREVPLDSEAEFTVEGAYTNQVLVKDGSVSVTASDCPGNDCVHSGAIHDSGRSIVCLPNRVEIRIEGESAVDFVVR